MKNKHSLDHIVQRSIYNALVKSSEASFSELKPADVDSNLFTYHLQKLIGRGYVEKIEQGRYRLSEKGRFFAGHFSTDRKDFVFGPVSLSVLAVYDKDGAGPLAFKRDREPYYQKYSLPSGKIHLGEGIYDAAVRELSEKAGIAEASNITYRGLASIYGNDGNHITALVWSAEVANLRTFSCRSGSTEVLDWKTVKEGDTIYATKELVALLDSSNKPFCIEIDELDGDLVQY